MKKNDASTPAPPRDRISGSDQNKPDSASGTRGGIKIDAKTEAGLKAKIKEHNEKHPEKSKRATLGQLKAVYRRGAGAFSTSHRPGMTRNQWAMGRVNAFLKLLSSGKPSNPKYNTDNDLLPKGHPKASVSKEQTFKPTAAMAANARRALRIRSEKPPSQRGMTPVGLARANQLIRRDNLSLDTVRRMKAYFDRHQKDKQGSSWSDYGKGRQAWDGWGGDEGWTWAKRILTRIEKSGCEIQPDCGLRQDMPATDWKATVEFSKRDDEQRLVFGWLYVSKRADGSKVIDHSGETIAVDTLEKAAYGFVLDARTGGLMHRKNQDGSVHAVARLVESAVFTPEKKAAMGIPEGSVPDGMWVGFKVDDDETWAGIKNGTYKMLSLGGKALRRNITE